ncbi:hypothetical protein A1Q1_00969 [Trichosporon asahii var. asahii CBS 2479]|uniref:Uncharacterized protein n=1 Tax=Trichosporon asahii var. asahii (strain ATCC 90039 / CBS 2479 / JCM 2466 / KCTC 7840 / NBRC 103889/ NCYC 2677 / UAMH 7654) TaxID=1186058 RepID=J5TA87_TRIAS|nr:hypothetical protein A1Q1_00969 [Trichosporon asahii var. asahii CBS 2479]EJT49956.1 hypothetical protein A1Q1_00969 [Trichosporon asahii var. asahii CBS 2479]
MSYNHYLPQKVDLTPKRHHGFQVVLFFLGWLLPPLVAAQLAGAFDHAGSCRATLCGSPLIPTRLSGALFRSHRASILTAPAVAVRFGIGRDFFINIILTLCGYIPGHGHNFYIQNIRNNSNKARTPKWAIRYGLVNNAERERKARKSQWAKRYDERLPESTFVGQELAEGEEGPNYVPTVPGQQKRRPSEGLWDREDEIYYNEGAEPEQLALPHELRGHRWRRPQPPQPPEPDCLSRQRPLGAHADRACRHRLVPPKAATDDDVPVWGKDYGRQRRSSRGSGGSGGNGGRKNDPDAVFNHEF